VVSRAKCAADREEMLQLTLPELMSFMHSVPAPLDAAILATAFGQCMLVAFTPAWSRARTAGGTTSWR